eukprot:scaffold211619_cov28-Tisochrysis_lutea.AAC.1
MEAAAGRRYAPTRGTCPSSVAAGASLTHSPNNAQEQPNRKQPRWRCTAERKLKLLHLSREWIQNENGNDWEN